MSANRSITPLAKASAVCFAAVFLLLAITAPAVGQQATTPQRGFEPGGSYALSNIESINTTNGNVMLTFPFKLPAGRDGLAGQLVLHYDSKDLDGYVADYLLNNSAPNWVKREYLGPSGLAAWHYGLGYDLEMVDKLWQRDGDEPITCDDRFHWQLQMALPDGSVHQLIPYGYTDNTHQNGYGWFDVQPGYRAMCTCVTADANGCTGYSIGPGSYSTGTITYYSTDGTNLRLDWRTDFSWTLYLGDGTRVTATQPGASQELIYDRNGNYIELDHITYGSNNHPAIKLIDQLGRYLILEYGSATNQDTIHMFGTGGATLDYQVKWNTININKNYQPDQVSLSQCPSGGGGPLGDPATVDSGYVVSEIDLPQDTGGLIYTFGYNAPYAPGTPTSSSGWGELSSITLPHTSSDSSPAVVQYHYLQDGVDGIDTEAALRNTITQKTLTYQQQYDGSSTQVTEITNYSIQDADGGTATITNPDGGVVSEYRDLFQRAYKTQHPDGSVVERIWKANRPYGYPTMSSCDQYGVNAYDPQRVNSYVKTEFTSIRDANNNLTKTAIKDYTYDKNNNVTSVTAYDWVDYGSVPRDSNNNPTGTIPSGAVVKGVTTNTYCNSTPDASDTSSNSANSYWLSSSPSLRIAVASTEVSDGSQSLSRSEFTYDDPRVTGNLTQQMSWDSTKGAYSNPLTTGNSISVSSQYTTWSGGATGKLTQTTDANGNVSRYTYGDIGNGVSDLYVTRTIVGDNSNGNSAVRRTMDRLYDFYTGVVTRVTDADNNVSTSTTYDVFGRPTLVKAADGITGTESDTLTIYSDVDRRVIVKSDLSTTGDAKLVSIQHYDQLGRVRLSRQLEDSTTQSATDETAGIKVQTRYFYSASNSYVLSSNPYRASTSGGASGEGTMGWTRSKSDSSGRMIEVQTFGGSGLPAPWSNNTTSTGIVTTAYDANFVTVTDQAGKLRRSMTNGLGQLVRVDEPDGNGNLGATSSPNQPTSYTYDMLSNLITVNQGSQTRTFTYSSLARLLTATNPESGTICYGTIVSGQCQANGYDTNGNLVYKTDARGVLTTYVYDALNRATTRSYSDSTPTVTYTYDSVSAYGKGRLASVSSSVSSYSYSGYDALGRPLGGTQTISSHDYSITNVAYDRAGHVTSMFYPSGHSVTFNYDTAGRLGDKDSSDLAFAGNLGVGGNSQTYSSITGTNAYDAAGHLTQEQFGTTPIYNKLNYNPRGQLVAVQASTSGNDTTFNRGKIVNDYGTTDNNGNLKQQTVYIPNNDQDTSPKWYQQYGYDSLNRLTQVHEYTGNTNLDWQQEYVYDVWGNRTVHQTNTYGTGIPKPNFSVNTANNRLGVPNGQTGTMTYDNAGNLTTDTYSAAAVTRAYDAENRMTSETQANNYVAGSYSYDGDGRRAVRNVNGVVTWQVYGLGGELLAEYALNGSPSSPQKEYGYRNGQLLITASVTAGSAGSAFSFTDDPLVAGTTTVKATHLTELRTAVNQARAHANLSAASWAESISSGVTIKASHITELRARLDDARQALGLSAASYTDPSLTSGDTIKAAHIQELRTKTNEALTAGGSGGVDIRWLVSDQLGTPRMIFDQSGSNANVSRHDYLPFGEELGANVGGRTAAMGYTNSDGARQKFTQKERDNETGLDYFGARYFASTQGRFTSPDPFSIIQMRQSAPNDDKTHAAFMQFIADPRRWNRFAYAVNSPLVFTDKTGLDIMIIENGPTKGNPIGHTAIAITGRGVYSMGNAEKGDRGDNKNNILGGGVKDYLLRELPRRNTTIVIIKTTAEQDAAAAKSMEDQAASKPMLTQAGILSDNCTSRANTALSAAGIPITLEPPTPLAIPGSAGVRGIENGNSPTVLNVPQNSNLTEADRQAIQQFEPARNTSPISAPGTPGGTPVITMPAQTRKKPEDE